MTIEEAAVELMKTYGKFGVDEKELIRLMRDGVEHYELTIEAVHCGLRMMLGMQFGIPETFTQRDVAAMLEISEEEAVEQIEKAKAQLIEQGEDMSKYIISEPKRQKFMLSPQKWTS